MQLFTAYLNQILVLSVQVEVLITGVAYLGDYDGL